MLSHFSCPVDNPEETFVPPPREHQVPVIGFSATFGRHDGLALASVFEAVVYHMDVVQLTRLGWSVLHDYLGSVIRSLKEVMGNRLCNVRFLTVKAKADYGVIVNKYTGGYQEPPLARVLDTDAMVELLVRVWHAQACKLFPMLCLEETVHG